MLPSPLPTHYAPAKDYDPRVICFLLFSPLPPAFFPTVLHPLSLSFDNLSLSSLRLARIFEKQPANEPQTSKRTAPAPLLSSPLLSSTNISRVESSRDPLVPSNFVASWRNRRRVPLDFPALPPPQSPVGISSSRLRYSRHFPLTRNYSGILQGGGRGELAPFISRGTLLVVTRLPSPSLFFSPLPSANRRRGNEYGGRGEAGGAAHTL